MPRTSRGFWKKLPISNSRGESESLSFVSIINIEDLKYRFIDLVVFIISLPNIKVFIKLSRWIHNDRMWEWPKNVLTFSWISTSGNKICFAKRLYRFRENYRKTKTETFLEKAMYPRALGTRKKPPRNAADKVRLHSWTDACHHNSSQDRKSLHV